MPTREYRDPTGRVWEVFEVHRLGHRPNAVRPALKSGWLAFVSAGEKRRLPEYPDGWTEMSDPEIQALLDAAFLAPEARYPVMRPGAAGPPPLPRTVSSVATPAITGDGLPVPPPPTMTGTLGTTGIDVLVRAHARQARQDGLPVIQGMVGVKRALREAGEDFSPERLRQLRKVFIDEFYFSR